MLANAPIGFKVGLQKGLAAQSTMKAELVVEALIIKKVVFCLNVILELGFDESFWRRVAVHRQHVGAARRWQPHVQPSRKTHRAEVFFRARTGTIGQDEHPLRQDR